MSAIIGIAIDVVIVALLLIFGLRGLKKGFIKSVLSVFSFAVCLVVAIWLAKYVAGWINNIYDFSNLIGNKISDGLIKSNDFFAQSINVYQAGGKDALLEAIPSETNGVLKQIIKAVFSSSSVDMTSSDSIGSVLGSSLGSISMIVISGILVFIILKIIIGILTKFFENLCKAKIIGGLDKVLGLVLGLLKGALIIVTVNIILVALTLVPAVNKTIPKFVDNNTYVEKYIFKTTDNLFGKYVIEGDILEKKIDELWANR